MVQFGAWLVQDEVLCSVGGRARQVRTQTCRFASSIPFGVVNERVSLGMRESMQFAVASPYTWRDIDVDMEMAWLGPEACDEDVKLCEMSKVTGSAYARIPA